MDEGKKDRGLHGFWELLIANCSLPIVLMATDIFSDNSFKDVYFF
jgi:hypothetical protein